MRERKPKWDATKWRALARVIAIGSWSIFLVSLLVMARWLLLKSDPGDPASPLPSTAHTAIPMIAMTVASAVFPIATISVAALIQIPNPTRDSRVESESKTKLPD